MPMDCLRAKTLTRDPLNGLLTGASLAGDTTPIHTMNLVNWLDLFHQLRLLPIIPVIHSLKGIRGQVYHCINVERKAGVVCSFKGLSLFFSLID